MPPFKGPPSASQLAGRKSVLSNKSLTRQVRGLKGKEGLRTTTSHNLYNNVTLVANTSDINYISSLNGLTNTKVHRMRVWVHLTAVANSVTRIIVFEDTAKVATNLVSAGILTAEEPFSSYIQGGKIVHPWSAKRTDKNIDGPARCRILKDVYLAQTMTANTKVARMFDVNFHSRNTSPQLEWGFLVISDQGNVIDINLLVDSTQLSN